jgi:hypothetical protein
MWSELQASAPRDFAFPAWYRQMFLNGQFPDLGPIEWRKSSTDAISGLAALLDRAIPGQPLVPFARHKYWVFCFDGTDVSGSAPLLGAYASDKWGVHESWTDYGAWSVSADYIRRQAELNEALAQPEPDLPVDRRALSNLLAPPGFQFPQSYFAIIDELPELEPVWWLVDDPQSLRSWGMIIAAQYPDPPSVPFAKADNNDDVYCFDAEDKSGDPPVWLIHSFAGPGWGHRGQWANFEAFLAAARVSHESIGSDSWDGLQP